MEYEHSSSNVWTQGTSLASSQNEDYYRQMPFYTQTTQSELNAREIWNAGAEAHRRYQNHLAFQSMGRNSAFDASNSSIQTSTEELADRNVQQTPRFPNSHQPLSFSLMGGNGAIPSNGPYRRAHTCTNPETWPTGQGADLTLSNAGIWKNGVNELGSMDSNPLPSNWSLSMTPRSETSGDGREGSSSRDMVMTFESQTDGIPQSRQVNEGLNQGSWQSGQHKIPPTQHAGRMQQVHAIASVRDGSNHPSRYPISADDLAQKGTRFMQLSGQHHANSISFFQPDQPSSKIMDSVGKAQHATQIKDTAEPVRSQKRARGSSKVSESSFSPNSDPLSVGLVDRAPVKKKTQRISEDSQASAHDIARSRDSRGQSTIDLKSPKDGEIPATPSSCTVSLGVSKCTVTGDSTWRRARTKELLGKLQGLLSSSGRTNSNQPDTSSSLGTTSVQPVDDKTTAWSMNEILAKAVARISQLPGRGDRVNEKETPGGSRAKSWCNGCGVCRECEAALVERRCSKPPRFPPSFPDDPSLFAPHSNSGEDSFMAAETQPGHHDDAAGSRSFVTDSEVDCVELDDLGAYIADLVPCLSMTLLPVTVPGQQDKSHCTESVNYRVGYVATSCRSVIGMERIEVAGHTLSELVHSEDLPTFLKAIQTATALCKENKSINGGRDAGSNPKETMSKLSFIHAVSWSARWRSNKTNRPDHPLDSNRSGTCSHDVESCDIASTRVSQATSQEEKIFPVAYRQLTGKVSARGGEVILSFDWKDPSFFGTESSPHD